MDHTTECGSLVRGGRCSVLAILIVFVSVCVPMYLSSEMNAVRRPVVAYTGTLGSVQTYSNTNISSFAAMGDLDEAVSTSSKIKTFSQGTKTLSKMTNASPSSNLDERG